MFSRRKDCMPVVKLLPKGQIPLPKKVREKLGIRVGDTLVLEECKDKIVLKKGKIIFDYAGTLQKGVKLHK